MGPGSQPLLSGMDPMRQPSEMFPTILSMNGLYFSIFIYVDGCFYPKWPYNWDTIQSMHINEQLRVKGSAVILWQFSRIWTQNFMNLNLWDTNIHSILPSFFGIFLKGPVLPQAIFTWMGQCREWCLQEEWFLLDHRFAHHILSAVVDGCKCKFMIKSMMASLQNLAGGMRPPVHSLMGPAMPGMWVCTEATLILI